MQNVKGKKRKAGEEEEKNQDDNTLIVEPHVIPNRGPYPYNQPKRWEELSRRDDCHIDILIWK